MAAIPTISRIGRNPTNSRMETPRSSRSRRAGAGVDAAADASWVGGVPVHPSVAAGPDVDVV